MRTCKAYCILRRKNAQGCSVVELSAFDLQEPGMVSNIYLGTGDNLGDAANTSVPSVVEKYIHSAVEGLKLYWKEMKKFPNRTLKAGLEMNPLLVTKRKAHSRRLKEPKHNEAQVKLGVEKLKWKSLKVKGIASVSPVSEGVRWIFGEWWNRSCLEICSDMAAFKIVFPDPNDSIVPDSHEMRRRTKPNCNQQWKGG